MHLSRSEQMSRIRGAHTQPERVLRSALWRAGLRFRLQGPTPAGRPDLIFPGRKVAVFVDGCFWHGCPAHYVRPRSRDAFWAAKLTENVARDRRQTRLLEDEGWRVVRVWEHEVFEDLVAAVEAVEAAVRGESSPTPSWRVIRVEVVDADADVERRHLLDLRDDAATDIRDGRRITAKYRRTTR
jgi:DNA mismatch endonuclease (patch repair protein)